MDDRQIQDLEIKDRPRISELPSRFHSENLCLSRLEIFVRSLS